MAYEIVVLTNMAIAILFALSLNVITGFCGQVSLGHAAFLGIGAYTSALLSKAGVPINEHVRPSKKKETQQQSKWDEIDSVSDVVRRWCISAR